GRDPRDAPQVPRLAAHRIHVSARRARLHAGREPGEPKAPGCVRRADEVVPRRVPEAQAGVLRLPLRARLSLIAVLAAGALLAAPPAPAAPAFDAKEGV